MTESKERKIPLAILAATWEELEPLITPLKASFAEQGWRRILLSKWGALEILLVETGVGKVNAAVATALAMEKWRPSLLLLIGIAGAMPSSGLKPSDLALATEEIYGDEGCMTEEGWLTPQSMDTAYLITEKGPIYHRFPLTVPPGLQLPKGPFVTLSAITGTAERAKELENIFPGIMCENMEGAAVAHVAAHYGVPLVEIRAMSNTAGPRQRHLWKVQEACQALGDFLLEKGLNAIRL
ncbi:MAG: futalosine hydrolase [Aquificota bacterium]|nr:MAG: futalosine hydrolase [Aquificota bacterium]